MAKQDLYHLNVAVLYSCAEVRDAPVVLAVCITLSSRATPPRHSSLTRRYLRSHTLSVGKSVSRWDIGPVRAIRTVHAVRAMRAMT